MKTESSNIIRLPQAIAKTGLSRSTIYSLVARGEFPKRIQLSTRSMGFLESEINEWIENKLSQRGQVNKMIELLKFLDETGIAYAIFITVAVGFYVRSVGLRDELATIKRELLKLKAVL